MNHSLPIYENAMAPRQEQPPWQWAADNIDYSRALNYDTPYRGKFDPGLMPFWCEPLEVAHDSGTRELVVLKCSRAGYSENLLLTDLRYTMDCAPEPTLYVTGLMDLATGFLDRRVKRGMNLCPSLRKKYKDARSVGTDIQLADMDFRATWSTSNTATKQDGWARIHADEVSLWGEFTVDMVRRRCAAYPFHHIIFGGSIDPTRKGDPEEDPTLKLYMESDRRLWMLTEPFTHDLFYWSLSGIQWDARATGGITPDEIKLDNHGRCVTDEWDMEAVSATSYYKTPNGKTVHEQDRMDMVRAGQWKATRDNFLRAGFKITVPMIPFADCTFGEIAKRFLSAKYRMNLTAKKDQRYRNTLRTYFAEMWAEAHRDEEMLARDETLVDREAEYDLSSVYVPSGFNHIIALTADVQKFHYWWLSRVWSYNDKTGERQTSLLDFGNVASINDLEDKAAEMFKDAPDGYMGIDIGYAIKATEVGTFCSGFTEPDRVEESQVIALRGSDQIRKMPIERQIRDALEGSRSAGRALFFELTWATDVFRSALLDAMNGVGDLAWNVPAEHGDERTWRQYIKQVTSTRKADGEWIVAGHGQDHLFDCEAMQMVLAQFVGLIQ